MALAVGGSLVGYAATTSTYQLTLDGKTREVRSGGDTVGEVLASEGIEVSEHDLVAPELDETGHRRHPRSWSASAARSS